ncbi:MAG TPA: hypothetical protein VIY47_17115, partial [Ignavibacteriaceae bacterium]
RKLGIAQEDLAGKSQQEIAGIVIKNYEALGRTVQATAAAQDILGKSFREQVPAIKAAADNIKEYEDRVKSSGAVASKALEEAGARQEKAISDLKLAITGLRNSMAENFADIVTEAAKWATEIVKYFDIVQNRNDRWIKEFGIPSPKAIQDLATRGADLGIPKDQLQSLIDKAKADNPPGILDQLNIKGTSEATVKYYKDLYNALKPLVDQKERELELENKRLMNKGQAAVNPLPLKPESKRLTEAEKNLLNFNNAVKDAFSDVNRQLEIFGADSDAVSEKVINLAHKLFDAGKGIVSYNKSLQIAADLMTDFQTIIEKTNTKKLNDSVKALNQDLDLQLKILTATTEKEKEQLKLRSQFNKLFENQPGG